MKLHACSLSGPQYSNETHYISYADALGFIALFPSSINDYNCWDVASNKSLLHEGGGDSTGLANIIRWAMSKYDADPTRIFVTGSSSGCMMTNIMCATYPDLFTAASCYSGFPAGCLIGSPGSSPETGDPECGRGNVTKSGTDWASLVRSMYPGYHGRYPRILIWHGEKDYFVSYHNLAETLKQWSSIFNISQTRNITDSPDRNYTEIIYGDGSELIGYSAADAGHTVPVHEVVDLKWFGLLRS